jgi:aliphatic nitrilase
VTAIRAAAVQLSPVLYSREGTVEQVVAKIDELATRGVQFATFPENHCSVIRTFRLQRLMR